MWLFSFSIGVFLALAMIGLPALAEQPVKQEDILAHQLNHLESRVIQPQRRTPRTRDLLIDQDLRISEQRLKTLKTKTPRNAKIPLLERQLDRVRRQNRLQNR